MNEINIIHNPTFGDELCTNLAKLTTQLSTSFAGRSDSYDQTIKNLLDSPAGHLWVATLGDEIVGCVVLNEVYDPVKTYGVVDHLVVDEKARGQSLGKRLMAELEKVAWERNVKELHLTSKLARVAAHQLYISLDYVPKDTTYFVKKLTIPVQ